MFGVRSPSAEDQTDAVPNRSKLNDREKKQAALPITVFGVDLVRSIKYTCLNKSLS